MNTTRTLSPKGAKISFIINAVLGVLMLVAGALIVAFGGQPSDVRESFGLLVGAVACLFTASINYAKYLSLAK
jgi:drug/metabolite transporter (DMT)-like permease